MILRMFTVGPLGMNCYVVRCERTGETMVIDPGFTPDDAEAVLKQVSTPHSKPKYIVNTHGHADHVSGNGMVKEKTGASILIHEADAAMVTSQSRNLSRQLGLSVVSPPADRLLQDGDVVELGQLAFTVIHTPGHTRGSISILGQGIVFVGDTLFSGSIGRTDLPGSSFEMIMDSIRNRLMKLPDRMKVYPGHGPPSTIGKERKTNLFLRNIL